MACKFDGKDCEEIECPAYGMYDKDFTKLLEECTLDSLEDDAE